MKSNPFHSFEPQAKMFCELCVNMDLNKCHNITLHHNALGNEEKWIEIYNPEERHGDLEQDFMNEGHGTVTDAPENFTGDKAKQVRLDSFNLENISFIKIDVEGYEMEVIRGALETIKKNKPTMIIEIFNDPEKLNKINEIAAIGYDYQSIGGDDYLFTPKESIQTH
jgi:FkbM family methyltransferase